MSRRDTIIIAVLVNAALLMILFATAMRSDHSEKDAKRGLKIGSSKVGELALNSPVKPSSADDLLNEFVSAVPSRGDREENVLIFDETELAFVNSPAEVIEIPVLSPVVEEIKVSKPKSEDQFVNVTVKKGDFLEKIAKANNTTVAAIMKANKISSTQLKIGQVLKVPLSEGKQATPHALATQAEYYIVREGDSPWTIATRNKIQLEELLRLNGLDEQKAKRLRPGDKLKIR